MGGAPEYASGSGNVKGATAFKAGLRGATSTAGNGGAAWLAASPAPTWTRGRFGLNITNLSLTPDTVAANSDP